MYRNAIDFCILILYLAALLNSLMSYGSFLVTSLRFSKYNIKSSAESEFLLFLFLVWLLWLRPPSNSMLNESSKSGHLYLFLILRKCFQLFTEYDVNCELTIYGLYYVEVCSFCIHLVDSFSYKWMLVVSIVICGYWTILPPLGKILLGL